MKCVEHNVEMIALGGQEYCPSCMEITSLEGKARLNQLHEKMLSIHRLEQQRISGIPLRFLGSSFSNFFPPTERAGRLSDSLAGYSDDFENQRKNRTGFLFLGLQGRGKTHLACSMANCLMSNGFIVRYASLPELTRKIKGTYSRNSTETTSDIVEDLISADFTILDEIDLHGSSDSDYQILYDIINGRYVRGECPTLAISNRGIAQLTADLDDRIISRILSGYPAIEFDWESLRDTPPDSQKR